MASFLDRMKAKMSGSIERKARPKVEPVRKSRTTIRTNRWDERAWKEARKTAPIDGFVNELMDGDTTTSREEFEMAPEMVHDLFMAAFKADPVLENKRSITREAYPVRKIMEELLESTQLQELQEYTAGDAMMSTIATTALKDNVMEILTRLPPPPAPPGEKGEQGGGGGQGQPQEGQGQGQGQPGGQPQEPQQAQNSGPNQGQEGGQPDGQEEGQGEGEGDGEANEPTDGTPEWDPDAEADQAEADWEDAYDKLLDAAGLDMDVSNALDQAVEDVKEVDGLRKGVGLEDGQWLQMSPEERMAIANRLRTPEMRDLANVIGRMRRFALGARATRLVDVPHEAFDVETGDDLKRLLKGQYSLLGTPETEYEFYRRLADKELLQFKMRGTEDAGKGPVVMCIDKSGSMHGKPFSWALGVAEALRRFAADDERDYYALFFGNNSDRNRFEFPKGKGPWEKIQAFLSVDANGGTQFDGVLTEALKRASESFDGQAKGKADIVFITDGAAHLSDDWIDKFNEERKRVGVRVYSVQVGGAYDYYGGDASVLSRFSDLVVNVKDLNPESASAIFEKV